MVVNNEPVKVENQEEVAIEQQIQLSKQTYDRLIKSKRNQKSLQKTDELIDQTYMIKCNLLPDI